MGATVQRRSPAAPPERGGAAVPEPLEPAKHYLHAGQLVVVREPAELTTILGTCVAVCLWDEARCLGGMNHFLLPQLVGGSAASPRFGPHAFEALLEWLRREGGPGLRLQAKVFGGMQATMRAVHDDLGEANAEVALRLCDEAGIPVVAKDVGGQRGRKLIFRVPSGEAWVKYL